MRKPCVQCIEEVQRQHGTDTKLHSLNVACHVLGFYHRLVRIVHDR